MDSNANDRQQSSYLSKHDSNTPDYNITTILYKLEQCRAKFGYSLPTFVLYVPGPNTRNP